jgi:hypothetical protein
MAIATIFIDFIVPIKTIKDKYPGGWEQCLEDHYHLIGGRVWYDEHLFHDGAMNPTDIENLVSSWKSLGFNTHIENDEGYPVKWIDVCVHEGMFGGSTLECDWLAYDESTGGVFLKGTDPGPLVTRKNFSS